MSALRVFLVQSEKGAALTLTVMWPKNDWTRVHGEGKATTGGEYHMEGDERAHKSEPRLRKYMHTP